MIKEEIKKDAAILLTNLFRGRYIAKNQKTIPVENIQKVKKHIKLFHTESKVRDVLFSHAFLNENLEYTEIQTKGMGSR